MSCRLEGCVEVFLSPIKESSSIITLSPLSLNFNESDDKGITELDSYCTGP